MKILRSTTITAPWEPDQLTITVPAEHTPPQALHAVRAVLMELGFPQPQDAAVCWCGDRITFADLRVSAPSRTVMPEEATHGA